MWKEWSGLEITHSNMKVILIKYVPKLGNGGDIVDVPPGYARNYLLARGLAQEATEQATNIVTARRERTARKREKETAARNRMRSLLDKETILVRASANEAGNLFGGVGPLDIVAAIAKRKKITVDPKLISLKHHLKTLGVHEVMVDLGGGEHATIFVDIQENNSTTH